MKEEEIKIRISETLKKDFIDICEFENTTMSNKINNFIVTEINEKKIKSIETIITDLLVTMNYNNVTIIGIPMVNTLNGKLVANDVEGHIKQVGEYRSSIVSFLENNKNKQIFLYLMGCDFKNNKIRAFVL